MVAPLDVYHNTMGVALSNEEQTQRQHRHHRRHQPSQQRHHRSTGHMPGFDPNQAELLLELGPDSGSREGSEQLSSTLQSDKENVRPQRTNSAHRNGHANGTKYGTPPQQQQQNGGQGMPHAPQRFIHQYLPPHLLKQNRPPMMPVGVGGGGGGPMYRAQYVEQCFHRLPYNLPRPPPRHRIPSRSQSFNRLYKPNPYAVVTPVRSGSHKNLKSNNHYNASNYNVSTEL